MSAATSIQGRWKCWEIGLQTVYLNTGARSQGGRVDFWKLLGCGQISKRYWEGQSRALAKTRVKTPKGPQAKVVSGHSTG